MSLKSKAFVVSNFLPKYTARSPPFVSEDEPLDRCWLLNRNERDRLLNDYWRARWMEEKEGEIYALLESNRVPNLHLLEKEIGP